MLKIFYTTIHNECFLRAEKYKVKKNKGVILSKFKCANNRFNDMLCLPPVLFV